MESGIRTHSTRAAAVEPPELMVEACEIEELAEEAR